MNNYENVLPKDAAMVVSVDLVSMAEKSGLSGDDTNAHQCDKKIVASHNSQSLDIVGLDFLVISNPSRAKTTPVVMISFCPLSAIPPNIAMPAPEAKMP